MEKSFNGSCHCGKVAISVRIDLAQGTGKCNCSICRKTRSWSAMVRPENFKLLSSELDLSEYQFNTYSVKHHFCKHCGVHTHVHGNIPELGGEFYSVYLSCLDDISIEELIAAPIKYSDGLNNNWFNSPGEIRHL